MSQMSTTSFLRNSASKKVEIVKKCEGVENGAKTKKDTAATSNANEGAKKSQDDVQQNGAEEAEVNPAFKRKSISVERDTEDPSKKPRSAENPSHESTGAEKKNQEYESPMETSTEALLEAMTAFGMENLAPEILLNIFGFLPFDDLKSAILVCRWWREVGESPSLWANLKLSYMDHESILPRLPQVLSLKRLQCLKSLNFGCVERDCANYLRMISDHHPSVTRISLDMCWNIDVKEVASVAETLVKFDEVDLSKGECPVGEFLYGHSMLVREILHASKKDSKLKILKMRFGDMEIFEDFLKMRSGALVGW